LISESWGRLAGFGFLVVMVAYVLPTKPPGFSGEQSFSYFVGRTFDEWTFSWQFDGLRMASEIIMWTAIGLALYLRVSERGRSFALGAVALFGLQYVLWLGVQILEESLLVSWTTYAITAGAALMLVAAIASVRRPLSPTTG
jgi:hypothetical protein